MMTYLIQATRGTTRFTKFPINIRPLGALFWAPRKEEKKGSLREETLPKERENLLKNRKENVSLEKLGSHRKRSQTPSKK